MKILVLSDTHGSLEKATRILQNDKYDSLWHLGDNDRDAVRLASELGIETVYVKGNCDGSMKPSESFKIVNTSAGKFYLTHGHIQGVNFDLTGLYMSALEKCCVGALFGHTHSAFNEKFNGVNMLNPGSLSLPRDSSPGSFAVINIEGKNFNSEIIYWKDELYPEKNDSNDNEKIKKESQGSSKAKGGYLRRVMNYSDGQ